ncbi:MAG: TRAP transporter small permease [Bacillota bacterium]|nr:TRAP transporter small permease [Bacillota bacterium]
MRGKIKKINYYMQYVSGFTLVLLMFLTVADVIMRSFLNQPIGGSYELTSVLLTFIVFYAVGHAQHYRDHVVIDVLYDRLPFRGKRFISYLSSIIYLIITAIMCYVVFFYSQQLIATNATTAILKIPHWPVVVLAAVGLIGYFIAIIADLLFLNEGGILSNDVD